MMHRLVEVVWLEALLTLAIAVHVRIHYLSDLELHGADWRHEKV